MRVQQLGENSRDRLQGSYLVLSLARATCSAAHWSLRDASIGSALYNQAVMHDGFDDEEDGETLFYLSSSSLYYYDTDNVILRMSKSSMKTQDRETVSLETLIQLLIRYK